MTLNPILTQMIKGEPPEVYYMVIAMTTMAGVIVTLFFYMKQLHKNRMNEGKAMTDRLISVINSTNDALKKNSESFNNAIKSFNDNTTGFNHTLSQNTEIVKETKELLHSINERVIEIQAKQKS